MFLIRTLTDFLKKASLAVMLETKALSSHSHNGSKSVSMTTFVMLAAVLVLVFAGWFVNRSFLEKSKLSTATETAPLLL